MASEEIHLVPPTHHHHHHHHHRLDSQLVFQDDAHLRFPRVGGDPGPKTRELSGFIDDRFFQPQASAPAAAEFRRIVYDDDQHNHRDSWNGNRRTSTTPSGDGSEGDEEEEEDDDEEDDEDDDEGDVGSNRGVMTKEGNVLQSGNDNSNVRGPPSDRHQQERANQYGNEVTVADPDGDLYYSQYLPGPEGSGSGQKDVVVENGCGFSGRKESSYSSESGESLRVILSDPVTGSLMDDAMILPCGHSFGDGGMQHVIRMKACVTCSHLVSEDSASPNLSLRAAVQAFRREEELQVYRSSKRRRDRFEQDKGSYGDSMPMDHPRGRGVQFPFAVTDRVVIKGNKRTPQRFVGREAIVTTQCLNGWYVVKTLDNAESVKLQYRSLAKVSDNQSSKPSVSKMTSDWL